MPLFSNSTLSFYSSIRLRRGLRVFCAGSFFCRQDTCLRSVEFSISHGIRFKSSTVSSKTFTTRHPIFSQHTVPELILNTLNPSNQAATTPQNAYFSSPGPSRCHRGSGGRAICTGSRSWWVSRKLRPARRRFIEHQDHTPFGGS